MTQQSSNLTEFIFGILSTPEGRLQQEKMSRIGLFHVPILTPLDPKENEFIEIIVRVGIDINVKSITLCYTTDETLPSLNNSSAKTLSLQRKEVTWDTLEWSYIEQWTVTIPGQLKGTHVQYIIAATTTTNKEIYCPYIDLDALSKLENLETLNQKKLKIFTQNSQPQIYEFYVDGETIPKWFQEAIIYEIFVDRFASTFGDTFPTDLDLGEVYGGTLQGIISKLDYLVDLGVTCLWLTPIFLSPSYHRYDPQDHHKIDPRLGTQEDWKILITEAHERDIRIILDFVANHLSNQHRAFISAQKSKNDSCYTWFRFIEWPDKYDCFFDVPSQPEVNSDHPEVRNYFIENAGYWLEQGCDGFRLDYANGCTHAFWSVFRNATRKVKPDSVTLGEIVDTPLMLRSFTGRMDGCLDFKLLELLRGFFAFNHLNVSQFDKALQQHFSYFESGLVLPSFLDNHDMNRFLWIVQGDRRRLKLAALCQFTLPYPPIIYYGTEIGLSQLKTVGRLEESRLPMRWGEGQNRELLQFYKQLIHLRRQEPLIWGQSRQTILLNDEDGIYGYACGNYTVLLNNSPEFRQLAIADKKDFKLILATQTNIGWDNQNKLCLLPFSGVVLSPNQP